MHSLFWFVLKLFLIKFENVDGRSYKIMGVMVSVLSVWVTFDLSLFLSFVYAALMNVF